MFAEFDRKYAAMAAVALAGIVALMVQSLQAVGQLRGDVAAFGRALGVQAQVQRVNAGLQELETSQRSYLLTLEPAYLGPYRAALTRLDAELHALSSATADWPDLAADIKRLRGLADTQRAELAQTIALSDTRGIGPAPMVARSPQGEALMNEIRQVLSRLDAMAGAALSQRQAAQAGTIRRNALFVSLLTAALAVLMVALYMLARRDRVRQEQILRGQTLARELLEMRVKERTSELDAVSRSLALSEQRLRGIFDSATDGIVTADASQTIVEANAAAARMFGCAVTDLIGSSLDRVIPARYREAHRQSVQAFGAGVERARSMRGDAGRVVMALRFDGDEFPIEASISHVDVDGQRLYTVIHRDISKRLQDEAALVDSRSRLAAALASMTDAVCICDADGRFVEFNDAFASFHRFRGREECPGTLAAYPEILDVFMADGTPAAPEQWAVSRALRGEVASSVEYRLRRKDTGESWAGSYSFAPISAGDGSIVGAVVSARDISGIKQAQAELAASHDALQNLMANQQHVQEDERKRIARELHDDLQQSLAAIRMDAVAVGERVANGRSDIEPLLARIDRLTAAAIASTRRIVNDLRPEMLEELGLVAALGAICARHAERTGGDCRFEVSPSAGDTELDAPVLSTGLYRITQEALNNVAKHAKASSVRVRLDCARAGLVMLRIADNGLGMQDPDKHGPDAFGLRGMAERVRALGGHMRIASEPENGTTIEVLVPVLTPRPAGGGAGTAQHPVAAVPHDRRQPAAERNTFGHTLQTVIDALAGQVAVLDRSGTVWLVNRGWKECAALNGDPGLQGCGPGVNYLDVCLRSASDEPSVRSVLVGLRAVLDGRDPVFMTEYPCDTPTGRRWFRMHAASITGGMAIVTHVDITRHPDQAAAGEQADDALH